MFVMMTGKAFARDVQIGQVIENIAQLTYTQDGRTASVVTAPARFEVQAVRTPSEIAFFRSVPAAPDAIRVNIAETYYSTSGTEAGEWIPAGQSFPFEGAAFDAQLARLTADVLVVASEHFHVGDVSLVRVSDAGQNGNPQRREVITVNVTGEAGDSILIELIESGPDTGEFWGYVVTASQPTSVDDELLTVQAKEKITARYEDRFDAQEVSQSVALVDPNGRIFDSTTGALLNGVLVSVVHADTGAPAPVFGLDGYSVYPSQLRTGDQITDASGRIYDQGDGEFLFPLMPPGRYRLEIEPPPGYTYPSIATNFDGLANSPFVISGASYHQEFTLDGTGPVVFDIPMDPSSQVTLEKSADVSTAAIGDFVPYVIRVTNSQDTGARLIIRDTPPRGFRVIPGSVRLDGLDAEDDQIRLSGTQFQVIPPVIPPGQTLELTYAMEVAAGAQNGLNRNRAIALDGLGRPLSNAAETSIFVYEDLLRSTSTIAGRVTEGVCGPDTDLGDEAAEKGIQGVRIYLETGQYVVTDENGFYHFEQVPAGTHVVRLDDGVLPAGVQPLSCGTAKQRSAQFVDLHGGVVWQADFQLERAEIPVLAETDEAIFNDSTEHKRFDRAWLDAQSPGRSWVYPDPSRTPSTKSVNIGVKHGPGETVRLLLNDAPLVTPNFAGSELSSNGQLAISRWRSVDIEDGQNRVSAIISDASGNEVERLNTELWYVENVTRARVIEADSEFIADGQTEPVIAVRFTDDGGRPVHAGRIVGVDIEPPHQLKTSGEVGIDRSLQDAGGVAVGPDGIAKVRLQPTLETGLATIRIELDNGRVERLRTYLKPKPRPWIVVGLAEVGAAQGAPLSDGSDGDGGVSSDGLTTGEIDPFIDGRIAVYAKGQIGDGWQATLAIDTDKRRGEYDQGFNREIDPSAAYNLFGDDSYQQHDAPSRYPIFAKLEKNRFQALLGDYNTNLQDTELSKYSRNLTGLKIVQESERYGVTLFAAETNQAFNTDELPADGTSGPYRLSVAPVLGQSETVTLQTRDRLRPDRILSERVLQRYLDYDLDYRTGRLIFRLPVNATDPSLNPNVIVVDYETSELSERHITAGGRVSGKFADGALEVGMTAIHEGGSAVASGQESQLYGVDLTWQISEETQVRAEYATTDTNQPGAASTVGDALFLEMVHQADDLAVTAYLREENTGFGLGQTRSNTEDIRRVGVTGSYRLSQTDEAESGERTTRSINGDVYREENLSTGEYRESAAVGFLQSAETLQFETGLRFANEHLSDGEHRNSVLVTGAAQKQFVEHGLTVSVHHEEPLNQQNMVSLFPKRTVLGVDKTLTESAILTARHEIVDGTTASGQNTVVGLVLHPWTGAEVRTEMDHILTDSSQRVGAVFGVDQSIRINDAWSASLGMARRADIAGDQDPQNPVADEPQNPLSSARSTILTGTEEFSSAYAGLAYRTASMAVSGRIEARDSTLGTRYTGVASAARQVTDSLSFAAAARAERDNVEQAEDTEKLDVRLAAAYRPQDDGLIVFDRLDVKSDKRGETYSSERVVNNLALSYKFGDDSQASVFVGTKYSQTTIGEDQYSGWTHLAGGQYRQQITPKIDVGVSGSALYSARSGTMEYAFGPSVGYRPTDDIWVSVGWNIQGFEDDDFEAAEYSREGPYVKMRVKFDETTIKGLVDRVMPRG